MEILNFIIMIFMFVTLPILSGGIIRTIRARAQGRKGPPVLQNLYDMLRFIQKKPVDGPNSGFFAEVSPVMYLVSGLTAWSLSVFEWAPFILLPFFLILQRVAIVGFAMETGTSFGGLGTSREMLLSIVSEPIVLVSILVAQSKMQLAFSWIGIIFGLLFMGALLVGILGELTKPPFDDPRTHLELTMVHEAMLLEASGRSMAFFEAGYQLKISALLLFLMRIGIEHSNFIDFTITGLLENILSILGMLGICIFIGYWESISVRRKWFWVPELMGMTLLFLIVLGTLIKL